jgi:DNA invertase Pin-like site-specific DNA recombinase
MFDRPALNAMLDDIKAGIVNCIVVKDLSRFGRNYIEVGRYIQTLFPILNVRFIAINDGYDSINEHSITEDYLIPFKNLINDAYCADISKKVRSQLEVKRKKGDYTGALVPFGYLKSPENKNKLIIDEIAAEVVKDIFKLKLAGISCQSIAEKLNNLGVLSPLEYKKSIGLGCSSAFKTNHKAKWSAASIKRILCEEVYTGVLIQGKTTTPSYKIKQKIIKDKSEWARTENAHEAIISCEDFQLVSDLLNRDSYKTDIYLFSGILFCPECRQNIVRKISTVKGNKYINYACLKMHKNDKRAGCSGIRIKESELFEAVTMALKSHINTILDIEEVLQFIQEMPKKEYGRQKLQEQANIKKHEIDKLENRKTRLYNDYSDGKITQKEYAIFKKNYDLQISETEIAITNIEREIDKIFGNANNDNKWLEYFKEYQDFSDSSKLSRDMIVKFIDKIIIFKGGIIEIIYRYADEYEQILTFADTLLLKKEGAC